MKILFTFHRAGGFYPIELESNESARANAEANPGTEMVVNEITRDVVWERPGYSRRKTQAEKNHQ